MPKNTRLHVDSLDVFGYEEKNWQQPKLYQQSVTTESDFDALFFNTPTYGTLINPLYHSTQKSTKTSTTDGAFDTPTNSTTTTNHHQIPLSTVSNSLPICIRIRSTDISANCGMDQLYRSTIPVVFVGSNEVSRLKVNGPEIRRAIEREILNFIEHKNRRSGNRTS